MKCIPLIFLFFFALVGKAQFNATNFVKEITWQKVKEKAQTCNKYIFVDCFATWCGPCKEMDLKIYPNDSVGSLLNKYFISVKIQMDTSISDDGYIKNWYADARDVMIQNKVIAYPTYLFFSPEGKPVHKDIGAKNVTEFISIINSALNPDSQYFTLLEKYHKNELDYKLMPLLSSRAKVLRDGNLALSVASTYVHEYLEKMHQVDFLKKENLEFIGSFPSILSSMDRVFEFYHNHPSTIDSIMGNQSYARFYNDYIISKEEVLPMRSVAELNGTDLNWILAANQIESKYGSVDAERIIVDAKINWYGYNHRKFKRFTNEYINSFANKIDRYGLNESDANYLGLTVGNTIEELILKYCTDDKINMKALGWLEKVMQKWPGEGFSYVYAGLLYKVGQFKAAIAWQELALNLIEFRYLKMKNSSDLSKNPYFKEQSEILRKMKNGEVIDWVSDRGNTAER